MNIAKHNQHNSSNSKPSSIRSESGFTLHEALALTAVFCVLALVQVSSLAGGSRSSQADLCRSNHRKLIQAWLMYSDDNNGSLVPNGGSVGDGGPGSGQQSWASGWMDFTSHPDNINTDYLVASDKTGYYGLLGPYLQRDPKYFHCPSDASSVQIYGTYQRRVRSVSMNGWMGGYAWNGEDQFVVYKKTSEISDPSGKFVTVDERADSINDSWLATDMGNQQIIDFPGVYHSGGTWLSFADGHVEFRRWSDAATTPPYSRNQLLALGVLPSNTPDANWLLARTSELK